MLRVAGRRAERVEDLADRDAVDADLLPPGEVVVGAGEEDVPEPTREERHRVGDLDGRRVLDDLRVAHSR